MPMHVVAWSRAHWHRFPYLSARGVAQTSKGIYADACGCMHATTCIGMDFPTFLREESMCVCVCVLACACVCPCVCVVCVPTFLGEDSPRTVGESILMHVVARSRMHRHRFPYFSGRRAAKKQSKEIDADACGCDASA